VGRGYSFSIREGGDYSRINVNATWEMEFNADQLDMLAFCIESMSGMLKEDLERRDTHTVECMHGKPKLSVTQLRRDLANANKILAGVYKGQVNLAVAAEVKKKVVTPRHGTQKRGKK
jgi:hypothetical protein